VDPSIQIVAVGDGILDDEADNAGRRWNETVLRQTGDQADTRIDYLSFHIYQPGAEGWQEAPDPEALHHAVCVAPLDVEAIIGRMAAQIAALAPESDIRIALDEWNLWLPPPPEAQSMHQVVYTLRDALYIAGMFHVFHRQCNVLSIANLAQLVNVLPLVVTDERRALATAIYYPFLLYRRMERLALSTSVDVATFDSESYSTIGAHRRVPYLDVTATRTDLSASPSGSRLVLGLVNRHPDRSMQVRIALRAFGLRRLRSAGAWLLTGPGPLAANTFDHPQQVGVRDGPLPALKGDRLRYDLPASSVAVLALEECESRT
jgi:alpha-N-arabinofuranosidase